MTIAEIQVGLHAFGIDLIVKSRCYIPEWGEMVGGQGKKVRWICDVIV